MSVFNSDPYWSQLEIYRTIGLIRYAVCLSSSKMKDRYSDHVESLIAIGHGPVTPLAPEWGLVGHW